MQGSGIATRKKAFLLVTIPTHLRLLLDQAALLEQSGEYDPVLIFHPSGVFDAHYLEAKELPYEAWIWNGVTFWPKAQHRETFRRLPAAPIWMPSRGYYLKLRQQFSFLPSPEALAEFREKRTVFKREFQAFGKRVQLGVKGRIAAIPLHFALTFGILRQLFSPAKPISDDAGSQARSFLQRVWLDRFSAAWNNALPSNVTGFRGALRRLGSDGLFLGITAQRRFYEVVDELLAREKPSILILPEANLFYGSHFVVRAAHAHSIPVMIVPFTIANTLEWAEAFYKSRRFQAHRGVNRLISKAFPGWVLQHRGRALILPPLHVLACEYFNMVPRVPWLLNSGNADVIAAENPYMADYYERAGIEKEKICLTGTLADDKLHAILPRRKELRERLAEQLGIAVTGKLILFGLPPNQMTRGNERRGEFKQYPDLLRFLVETVTATRNPGDAVLISLHPRIRRHDVEWIESLGARIVDEPVETLIPLADLYIAVVSATIRIAISASVPVLNFDAFHYYYDDFVGLKGVVEVRSKVEYAAAVKRFLHEPAYWTSLKEAQQRDANRLAVLDGQAGARMLELVRRLETART